MCCLGVPARSFADMPAINGRRVVRLTCNQTKRNSDHYKEDIAIAVNTRAFQVGVRVSLFIHGSYAIPVVVGAARVWLRRYMCITGEFH
jgi:hypothetical protein